jgi:hydroxymethylbilane synthase
MTIRIGTRGSKLALLQCDLVASRLRAAGHEVAMVRILTEGDERPVDMTPGEGVFVAAIARALLAGEIDLAVHSAKDIPLDQDPDLVIGAFPERADPRDALVTREGGGTLEGLQPGAVIGTDSPRRAGFVLAARPDLRVVPLHGNVDTRLARLDGGGADALLLAAAGVDRLGAGGRIDERLDPEVVAPAPAQGALAVQVRAADGDLRQLLADLDDPEIRLAAGAERAVLQATGGTCRAPVGALATVANGSFSMIVGGVNSDGSDRRVLRIEGEADAALELAAEAGRRLAAEVALR